MPLKSNSNHCGVVVFMIQFDDQHTVIVAVDQQTMRLFQAAGQRQ